MARPRTSVSPLSTSIRQPVVAFDGRQPAGVVGLGERRDQLRSPIERMPAHSGGSDPRPTSAEMNFGFQRGTKLCRSSSVQRHEKAVLTTQSSSPSHASSCPWISPVNRADRARKQASCCAGRLDLPRDRRGRRSETRSPLVRRPPPVRAARRSPSPSRSCGKKARAPRRRRRPPRPCPPGRSRPAATRPDAPGFAASSACTRGALHAWPCSRARSRPPPIPVRSTAVTSGSIDWGSTI